MEVCLYVFFLKALVGKSLAEIKPVSATNKRDFTPFQWVNLSLCITNECE